MEMEEKSKGISEEILLPEKITAETAGYALTMKGIKGEVKREFKSKKVSMAVVDGKIIISSSRATKRESKIAGTFVAHIKNMVIGLTEGHKYILKICSGHFPINVSITNKEFTVKNFLGEKVPRILKLKGMVNVKLDGEFVVVEGSDKELTAQTAASIEQLCKIRNRDLRVFQDGIYIISKDGKEVR